MKNAPDGYVPWYFPIIKYNKAPDVKCSWKDEKARLSYEQALKRLEEGLNVGIAARKEDPLIIIDIDDYSFRLEMPNGGLIIKSRKRCGFHGFYWKGETFDKINIPTDSGEIRAVDQYVVVAGSYCETSHADIENQNIPNQLKEEIKRDDMLGVYTVDSYGINWNGCATLNSLDVLPSFFLKKLKEEKERPQIKSTSIKPKGKHSALFDLTIRDIISIAPTKREPHPLHESDTGMNFSVSDNVAHCWRHNVSLNALQFLVVKSGYMSCLDAGTGHKGSNAGTSKIINDNGAIFYAWLEAKKCNLIPKNDPIPVKAMKYIAIKHNLIKKEYKGEILPNKIYNIVLKLVEERY